MFCQINIFSESSDQKISKILVLAKSFKELSFQKILTTKKHAPKLILFNEKKLKKIPVIFDIEN